MTDEIKGINWVQARERGDWMAWADGITLTDTGMSVLGKRYFCARRGIHEVRVEMNMRVGYKGTPHEDCNRNPAAAKVVEALKAQEAALRPGSLKTLIDQYKEANPDKDVTVEAMMEWINTVMKEKTPPPPADKDVEGQTHLFEDQEKEQ